MLAVRGRGPGPFRRKTGDRSSKGGPYVRRPQKARGDGRTASRRTVGSTLLADLVVASPLVIVEFDIALVREAFEQIGETPEAVIAFAKARVDAADRLLERRSPKRVVILLEGAIPN